VRDELGQQQHCGAYIDVALRLCEVRRERFWVWDPPLECWTRVCAAMARWAGHTAHEFIDLFIRSLSLLVIDACSYKLWVHQKL